MKSDRVEMGIGLFQFKMAAHLVKRWTDTLPL